MANITKQMACFQDDPWFVPLIRHSIDGPSLFIVAIRIRQGRMREVVQKLEIKPGSPGPKLNTLTTKALPLPCDQREKNPLKYSAVAGN